jgi:hypothetical protein
MANDISRSLGGTAQRLPDYTPLLGTAIAGISLGLAATFLGIAKTNAVEEEREVLAGERSLALRSMEQASRARWARLETPPAPPAPLVASADPTPPPMPTPEAPPRKPLVKR